MTRTTPPVSVFGVPTDIGASRRGASMGPEALRVAGLVEAIAARGIDVRDIGDVQGPRNPTSPPVDGYRHLDEVVAWNRAVFDASTRELQAGRLPIMLGGDHCLGIGAIAAVAAHCRATGKKLRVLWLDAHADFNTREITPSGNIHGMPVACLCGLGPERADRDGGFTALTPDQIRQIGIRSVDPGEKRLVQRASAWTSTTCATSTKSACAA
jgi:arginase